MDEKPQEVACLWPTENIDDEDNLLRLVPIAKTCKIALDSVKRRIPNEASFALRPGEEGLSMNWSKYCCEKKSLHIKGITYSTSGTGFIEISQNLIFKFPVYFLKDYGDVKHTPIGKSNPSPIGEPNNKSHSELFPHNELKMRVNLSDYCRKEYHYSFCKVDMKLIQEEVNELRNRLNDTPYHKDWNFDEM
ncbi:hypothetical protein [Sphingobacterium sp. 1.A.5]|uniref:hypothetical protein n=1 Tax=Sphingobacterium sp. 1.A.5 TaxID=2044604 RepID=UPI000C0BF2C5|nr:hypothetical protein [Sphingobacterium sp. 1.A.5]